MEEVMECNDMMADMFAAGCASVAQQMGMPEKDAEAFVGDMCKQAARGRFAYEDEYDDRSTFWSRNKSWLLPIIVGASGERHGRKDRSYLSNAGSNIWQRVKNLFGYNADPIWKAVTEPSEVAQ